MNVCYTILTLIISIMALTSERIKLIVQVLLSILTTYWIFHHFYNGFDVIISDAYLTTKFGSFAKSNLPFQLLLTAASTFVFFYVLLRWIVKKTFNKLIIHFFKWYCNKISTERLMKFREFLSAFMKKFIKKVLGESFLNKHKGEQLTPSHVYLFENLIYSALCFVCHFVTIFVMFKFYNLYSILILALFFIIIFLYILIFPIIINFKEWFVGNINNVLK